MLGYTWIQWLFFFFFYSFFGWCFESTYVSLHEKRFVNRGFIRGPFLPLYGTGALMMLIVSMPFQDNLILTYVAGCVGATVLEYITGVLMETLFKVRYWDYSHKKFNFQGQICLESSLAWTVTVPSREEAETMAANWNARNQEIYAYIMTHLL